MSKNTIAVDLGGTNVRVALMESAQRLKNKIAERTVVQLGPDGVIDQIVRMANTALTDAGATWRDIDCMAISSPGPLDPVTGIVYAPPNMPGWHAVPLKRQMEERTGVPVRVINDAHAAGLGEFHFGAGQGKRNLVYLTVSTGIGGGVIVEGKLLEGSNGAGGHLGHITLDRNGPRCPCGNIGCLETLASGTAIARIFSERLAAGRSSAVTGWTDGPTAADVTRGVRLGDPLAIEVFTQAAETLGFGVVSCIHIFNPDVVVLGGGVTAAGDLLFDIVRRIVREHTLKIPLSIVDVVPAQLGEDAGLTGAAEVARQFCGEEV